MMENIEFLKKQISIMMNLFNARKFDQIIDKGTVLLKKYPEHAILYNITALAYNAVGKASDAKKILIKILKEEPKNISVLNNLGLACVELGDNDHAEEYYNKEPVVNWKCVNLNIPMKNPGVGTLNPKSIPVTFDIFVIDSTSYTDFP